MQQPRSRSKGSSKGSQKRNRKSGSNGGQDIRRTILRAVLLILGAVVVLNGLLVLLVLAGAFGRLPVEEELRQVQNPVASEVYSADGVLMGKYYIQNRQYLDPSEIPSFLKDALIATEDVRFYEHNGIDGRSLLRVFFKTLLLQKESSGGGSTLTQQLAKNLYPRRSYGPLTMPVNKVKEMATARRIEKVFTKEQILESYLSTVPFAENTYGIRAASLRFFNRNPGQLKMEEVAVLVGMLKATSSYNPVRNPDKAIERRNVVLGQVGKYGYLEPGAVDSLQQLPLEVDYNPLPHNAGIAPYFREFLRRELDEWCSSHTREGNGDENGDENRDVPYNLYTDGLRVYTTIDSRLQQHAEDAVKRQMAVLQERFEQQWGVRDLWAGIPLEQQLINYDGSYRDGMESEPTRKMEVFTWEGMEEREYNTLDSIRHYLKLLQAGFLAMETGTGEIRAWVGGINHEFFKYDHVRSRRQVGSTFKPLVYLEALEQGYSPCEYFPNDSIVYYDYDDWTPQNANREYGGFYSLKGGLIHSVNTVTAQLMMQVGIDSVVELAHNAGITADLPSVPSLALGAGTISLYEMVRVYQAIANRGVALEPVYLDRIEDRNGNLLYKRPAQGEGTRICNPDNAELMIALLREVVNEGTARGLRSEYGFTADIAGKTGTTQDYTDGWFIGFTPGMVAGAWVGGDIQSLRFRSMPYGQGAVTAMPIWAGFMNSTFRDSRWSYLENEWFDIPLYTGLELACADFVEDQPREFRLFEVLRDRRILRNLFRRRRNDESRR